MELPKFNETFMPILQTLSNGEVVLRWTPQTGP